MSFAWPHLLWLLLVPGLWLLWELTHRRRRAVAPRPKILRAEAGARALHLTTTAAPRTAHTHARFWLCAGLAFAITGLARPQWGRIEEQVFDQSREILLAVDLSRSMLAQDVKPSRLDRAKLLIQALLERLEGERVGLLVFAGTAFLQSPLSADYEILREFLPALGPDYLPEGGSNYGALLDAANQSFGTGSTADRFLIVLSDGEATDAEWKSRLSTLKDKGVRVIGLGVGTAAGAMIPDEHGGFVKDERGAVVLSKLENGTLQELATATDGVYRDASTWVDLAELLRETVEAGRKGDFVERNQVRLVERFQWALAPALLCFLLSFWREFPVRPKPRDLVLKTDAPSKPPLAAALFLCLLLGNGARTTLHAAAPTADADPLVAPLSNVVGRLSAQPSRSAADWAELARTTITYGQHLQNSQQQIPEGAVRDALGGVELGHGLDGKAADWPQLRQDLEALLPKPQEKPPEPPQDQQQQDQEKQQQDRQNPSQQDGQSQDDPDKGDPQNDSSGGDPSQQPPQSEQPKQQQPDESAFGDMLDQPETSSPPPSDETQKVGGNPDKSASPKDLDPALAVPLQKLEQLRNEDSPAKLFQLMEGEKKPDPAKKGKDW